jgi:hypothetical protein
MRLPTLWGDKSFVSYRKDGRVNPEFKKEVFLRYGLVYDERFPNDGLPIGLTKTNDDFFKITFKTNIFGAFGIRHLENLRSMRRNSRAGLSVNCQMCHSSLLPSLSGTNRVAYGVPNMFFDFENSLAYHVSHESAEQ